MLLKDNICGVYLADMPSLNKCNKGTKYLLCAIDLFSRYAGVAPWKVKRAVNFVNAFQKMLDSSTELHSKSREAKSKGRKPNKIWVDKGGEFYNNIFKRFLKINNVDMYSKKNEGKPVVSERFVRTLKNKIFKHMAAIFKNVYFDALDDIA